MRFVPPLFLSASAQFAPIAITLGGIGILYGVWFCAYAKKISSMVTGLYQYFTYGFCGNFALYAGTLISFQGLMIQMLAHGLSSAALFIMSGQLYERLHTRDLFSKWVVCGSNASYYPPLLMFFVMAIIRYSRYRNFIGEFHSF